MKSKLIAAGLMAASLAGTAMANTVCITVVCPSGIGVPGVQICMTRSDGAQFCASTPADGSAACITVPSVDTYNLCLITSTLPPGTTLVGDACQSYHTEDGFNPPVEYNVTGGNICSAPPSACWETGGGTLDKVKGDNVWTFGGNIYPGCSSAAGEGGSLNIVNHVTGLHFHGTDFTVDDCRGVSTRSPKVTVNIIDWHGTGYVTDDSGLNKTPVAFMGTFQDAHDGGAGADGLYIAVTLLDGTPVFQIGGGPDNLDILTTGNVQIHQSSCGKGKP
jgi:hypothetical protein